MRLLALATMFALGALLGLPPVEAFPPRPPTVKVSNFTYPVTVTFNNEVGKVRTMDPPPNFDEKGKLKKYTKAELRALKGDTPAEKKLAGYKAEFSEMKVGDTVQVSISTLKGGTTKPVNKDKAAKKDNADSDAPAKEDKTPPKGAKIGKWVVTSTLVGKVTKITGAGTDTDAKMTIEVKAQVVGPVNPNARQAQTLDADKYAATLVVIAPRPPDRPIK